MLRYRVLGPLQVERDGAPVEIAGQRQRAVLSLLLLHANRLVPVDVLVDDLWGEHPPPTATTSLQNAISQLRKALGTDAIDTTASGYLLHVEPGALDAAEFERLVTEARLREPRGRPPALEQALALWRGPPWAELSKGVAALGDSRRLEELRLAAVEERLDALLEAGEDGNLIAELRELLVHAPHRERLHAQLMLALYRSGRQAEALDAYHAARRALVDELGIEPGHDLQELHGAILRQERTLGRPVPAASPETHAEDVLRALLAGRLVPVLGSDVARSNGDVRGGPPGERELAGRLADLFGCPDEARGSLARVSEWVALTDGVGPLYDELHALLDSDFVPGPVERYLATLPPLLRARGVPQPLVVTTSYDETLECALRDAGEEFDVVAYVAHGPRRGRFVHIAPDGTARVVDDPNADALVTTDRVPVILKIHGCVDRSPERSLESFVVSEDDYIDYLAGGDAAQAVPVSLAAKLRRSHFLFLGYRVLDWNLRVFLRRLWGDERVAYRSWAVQADAASLERDFWRHRNIDVLDLPLDAYVATLAAMTGDLQEVAR